MAENWDDFAKVPAGESWDDFAKAGPRLGMGDVQAAPSAQPVPVEGGTKNLPVSLMTGDPETDSRLADIQRAGGNKNPITGKTVAGSLALLAGAAAPEVLGPIAGGALGGALTSGALSKSQTLGGRAYDAGLGALLGAGGGYVIPRVAAAIPKLGKLLLRMVTPAIKPTEEASRLVAQGVPLTTGQLNPDSYVNTLEQASDRGLMGMAPQREAAQEAWRNVVLKKPLAPGQAPPTGGTAEKLETLYQGFEPQYAPIKAAPVPAGALNGLPEQALVSPRAIDARTKASAAAEIKNALTILPEGKPATLPATPPGPSSENVLQAHPPVVAPDSPPGTVGDLLKVRSNLREQLRAATRAQDWDKSRILQHATDTVTDSINQNLPPELQQELQAVDQRYHTLAVLENAAARSGLSGEFTPKQLGAALKVAEGQRSFAQGGGGALRQLAGDANAVFTPTVQPTGMRPMVTAALPKWAVAPVARSANLPAVRAAMLRAPTGPLSPSVIAASETPSSQAAALIAALRRGGFGLTPAIADEEAPR